MPLEPGPRGPFALPKDRPSHGHRKAAAAAMSRKQHVAHQRRWMNVLRVGLHHCSSNLLYSRLKGFHIIEGGHHERCKRDRVDRECRRTRAP